MLVLMHVHCHVSLVSSVVLTNTLALLHPCYFFNHTPGRMLIVLCSGLALALSIGCYGMLVATHIAATAGDLEGVPFESSVQEAGKRIRTVHLVALSCGFLLSVAVSSMHEASSMAPGTTTSCTCLVQHIRRIRCKHLAVCCSPAMILFAVQHIVNALREVMGARSILSFVVPLILSKFCLMVLRTVARADKRLLNIVVGIAFALNVMVSLTIRMNFLHLAHADLLTLTFSCLAVSTVEFIARMGMGLSQLLFAGYAWRRACINRETLDGILTVAGDMQHRMDLHYGQLWIDQFAEVFVIMHIVLLQLAQPVWAQYLIWGSYAEHENRHGQVLISLLIQLGVELVVDSSVLKMCYHIVPIDTLATFRRHRSQALVRPQSSLGFLNENTF